MKNKKSALEISDEIGFKFPKEINLDVNLLIQKMEQRQASLQQLIDRDFTANTLAVLEAWRELKYWKEAILRGEFELDGEEK